MNKKLLFGIMSLAALTACTNDEFESQNVAEETSPVKFEIINANDAMTRASMNGNKIVWNANDGDLFTLYHGGAVAGDPLLLSGCQNAIYAAKANEGSTATLTTPSMIKPGKAIMVWPVDSVFRIDGGNISIQIPAEQTNIENKIPYVSDLVDIAAYNAAAPYNTAGFERSYPVYMRPMASQLIIKTDYAGTDNTLASLYTGDDPIDEISVTSIDLLTQDGGADEFTTQIPLIFKVKSAADNTRWNTTAATKVAHNAWSHVTAFDVDNAAPTVTEDKLTSKVLAENNGGCKFLMLPQANVAGGVDAGAVVVNTIYGKVVVATPGTAGTLYTGPEAADAWYRYISEASKTAGAGVGYDATETPAATAGSDGKFKTTSAIENGMMQTINGFSTYTHQGTSPVQTEPEGAAATRYVKVLLTHLDMSGLHVTSDRQLRNVVRVWKKMNLGAVTVYLDGDKTNHEFAISQKTIETINSLNTADLKFKVKPCRKAHVDDVDDEFCDKIVITGADYKQDIQNIAFIAPNENTDKVDVVLAKETTAWKWNGTTDEVKQIKVGTGVNSIINKGTLVNAVTEATTLAIFDATPTQIYTVPFKNEGTWTISGGDLNVQFDVTNVGTVEIAADAEYHADGRTFTNDAETLPERFLAAGTAEKFGKVNNHGVFACVHGGTINNYGLIEHLETSAKTYITTNTLGTGFAAAFNKTTNKIGRINLPYSNKDEENVSISNGAATGFVSVTVSTDEPGSAPANGKLDLSEVGAYVNYCIIKSGVTEINKVADEIKYVEFDAGTTEIAWNLSTNPKVAEYNGLIVFSPVNVSRNHQITINNSVYLKAKMYVGGWTTDISGKCAGYYGDTSTNYGSMYITY